MSAENIKPGFVYLAEVLPTKYRPAVVVNNFGNHSTVIPLRRLEEEDVICGLPRGQRKVKWDGNDDDISVAQCNCIKSIPNLKIVKELGMMDALSVSRVNDAIQFGRAMCE